MDSAGTATYKRDGAGVTAPVLSDSSAVYTPGISERRSSTTKFYGTDRLGTNSLETNSSQTVTSTKTYDAFGMLQASTGSSALPFGFAGAEGYQEDPDSGLMLLGHRYYDSSIGRFLSRDSAQDGRNWYSYCENNPLKFTDPEGLSVKGDNGARRAENAVGKGPEDCEDWILKHVYPKDWSDGFADDIPGKLEKRDDWEEVPNDGDLKPGDVITIGKADKDHGHVVVIGNKSRKRKVSVGKGKSKKEVEIEEIDVLDASLNSRKGTRRWKKKGTPFEDPSRDRNGPVRVWRPKDVPKKKKK